MLHSIEAARGIAALLVLLMHAANLMNVPHFSGHVGLGGIFDFGYIGVDFFFVLSGFVIAYTNHGNLGQPAKVVPFLWRRACRIFPIFWISLLLAVLSIAGGRLLIGKPINLGLMPTDILGTLLLIRPWEPKFLGVAWSLQYEVMFYALFTLFLVSRRLGLLALGAWVTGMGLLWSGAIERDLLGILSGYTLQFVLGAWTASLIHRTAPLPRPFVIFGLSCIALLAAAYLERAVFEPHGEAGRLVVGLSSAAMIYALARLDLARRWQPPMPLVKMGSASYAIYLNHITVLVLFYAVLDKLGLYQALPEVVVYGCGVALALVVTTLIGLWIELPLVAWLKRRLR